MEHTSFRVVFFRETRSNVAGHDNPCALGDTRRFGRISSGACKRQSDENLLANDGCVAQRDETELFSVANSNEEILREPLTL